MLHEVSIELGHELLAQLVAGAPLVDQLDRRIGLASSACFFLYLQARSAPSGDQISRDKSPQSVGGRA
jgi:hypothetical protein